MIPLLLAAVLQVGPPAPIEHDQTKPAKPIEERVRVLEGTFRDALVLSIGGAVDVYGTEWALHKQPGRFEEANGFGFNGSARVAWKTLSIGIMTLGCRELRKDGHHKAATIISTAAAATGDDAMDLSRLELQGAEEGFGRGAA